MSGARGMLNPGTEGYFDVFAIGLNYEGKLSLTRASGSCTRIDDHIVRGPYRSQQDAEHERDRLLERFRDGCHPDYWSISLRLEIWTLGQWADAVDSGYYATFW